MEESPWLMPLVVRLEKSALPLERDVLEAAARAPLMLSDDPRAQSEWAEALALWMAGPFRKVARRARGRAWEAAAELAHVQVRVGDAQVLAMPPVRAAELDPRLRALQVSGTNLSRDWDSAEARPGGARMALNPDVEMSTGKAMAQMGHASMMLRASLSPQQQAQWRERNYPIQVVRVDAATFAQMSKEGVVVRDAGFTEIPPGSNTVIALY